MKKPLTRFINKHNSQLVKIIKDKATDCQIINMIWWIEENTYLTKDDIEIEKLGY
ncbi:hypothetical protein ACQRXC_29200 (plasmid) [Niallia taxi]|uniref:hypothetical protein n=1 Tax=Niallia taxi TaxID=2499688 RepID=UPI003F61FFE3